MICWAIRTLFIDLSISVHFICMLSSKNVRNLYLVTYRRGAYRAS